ncbi:DNA recombination protein RmuC [Iodidimonas sp. SYSU 1G8]|uniref:DNA recombination protein RmuC n=1 Tax=Iodidimonas sp. SYSU 1G8 TaxID=3133967 RepID=UPI0031FE79CB
MADALPVIALILSALAALFAFLAFLRAGKGGGTDLSRDQISGMLREETDRQTRSAEEQLRGVRLELGQSLMTFQETMTRSFRDLSDSLGAQVKEFGASLDKGLAQIDERSRAIGVKLDQDIARMGDEARAGRETLHKTIDTRLEAAAVRQETAAKNLREEMLGGFRQLGAAIGQTLEGHATQQRERLENVTGALAALTQRQEGAQEALRLTVEGRLDFLRSENAAKLDEMRATVDEKLQTTLDTRLGESFNRVVEQLERVHTGLGEMQTLASGVGDLKKVLSNVRVRGTFGEVQAAMLLEQFLSPEQLMKNVQIKENSAERVEFCIRLPGRDGENEVLLPVDAKFPQEDYERLVIAAEAGDLEAVNAASRALETRVRAFAKSISEKYIETPRTTEFAILFLPTESLYAELLRKPGLFERLQMDYRVTLTGPTTFGALLNALQMGFRSLALEKRSSEVWQVLGAIKGEFGNYNDVVKRLSSQLETAARSVEKLGVRTRAMNRKLRDVETLPGIDAQTLLGAVFSEENLEDSESETE